MSFHSKNEAVGLDTFSRRFMLRVAFLLFSNHLQMIFMLTESQHGCPPGYSKDEFIFSGNGYVVLSRNESIPTISSVIKFDFKTMQNEGLLFFSGSQRKKSFLSLELRNGKVLFQFDLGSGRATVISNQKYDDGKWHVLEARLINRNGSLLVDGVTVSSATCPGPNQRFSPTDRVHFGGFNGHHNVQGVSEKGFEGSIKDVRFENANRSIKTYVEKKNVVFGCPKRRKRSNGNGDIRSLGVVDFYASYIGATNIEIRLEVATGNAAICSELYVRYCKEGEYYDDCSTRRVTDYLVELDKLEKNTTYEFWVSRSEYNYPDRPAQTIKNTTGTGLSMIVDSVAETSISVSWPDFVQGQLKYALAGNDSWQSKQVSGTGYNLTELTPGTAYTLRFRNDSGEVVERDISTRPSRPVTFTYEAFFDNISLSWGNSEEVEVKYTKDGDRECKREIFSGNDGHILNLGPSCTYHLEIVALSNGRKSEKTTEDVIMNEHDPHDFKCRPGDYRGQIHCEWGPKQNMTCQKFRLNFTSSEDGHVERTSDILSTTKGGLKGGRNYSITIQRDVTIENSTIPVVTANAIAQLEVDDQLFLPRDRQRNDIIYIDYYTDTSQHIEYYNVTLGNQSEQLYNDNDRASFDGLVPGNCYSLSASAVSLGLTSKWKSKTVCTVPNPPSSVKCNSSTNNSLILRIEKPTKGKFDYYMYKDKRLNHHTSSGFDFVTINDGFEPFTNYSIDVRTALNTNERSYPKAVTCQTAEGRPGIIDYFRNTSFETHSLHLIWREPKTPNGRITAYIIRFHRKHERHSHDKEESIEIGPDERNHELNDLTPGKTYTIKIVAVTSAGEGVEITKKFTLKEYDPLRGMLIASVVLLPILLIVLVALLVCYFVRNSPSRLESVRRISSRIMNRNMEMRVFKQPSVISKPVKVSEFLEYVKVLEKDSGLKFTEEYEDLKYIGRNQNKDEAELQCNRVKNRFTNILPYDISRVKLLPVEDEEGSDYINASWIPGFHSKREFIASQGPLPSTITDFWRMIWENNCQAIVMLTLCVEKGHIKCEQYWPMDNEPVFYGDVKVEIQNEDKAEEWHIREFKLSLGAQSRKLWHLHYISWPDMYVPEKLSLIAFIRIVRETFNKNLGKGPIVVHCSAGVGRTGTFVALDTLLHQLQEDHDLDIYGVVFQMRMCRVLMVQTEVQYIFIYECLKQVLEERNGLDGTKADEALMDGNETKRYIIDSNSEEQIKDEKQPLVKSPKEEDSGKVSDKENEKQPITESVKTEDTKVESNKEEKEVNKEPVNKEPVSKDTETSKEPVKKDTESSKEPVKTDTESNKEPVKKDTESSKEPVSKDTESSKEPVNKDTESSKEPVKKDTESKPNVEPEKETTGKE